MGALPPAEIKFSVTVMTFVSTSRDIVPTASCRSVTSFRVKSSPRGSVMQTEHPTRVLCALFAEFGGCVPLQQTQPALGIDLKRVQVSSAVISWFGSVFPHSTNTSSSVPASVPEFGMCRDQQGRG